MRSRTADDRCDDGHRKRGGRAPGSRSTGQPMAHRAGGDRDVMTDGPSRPLTLLVVDDHEVVRQGLVGHARPAARVPGRGRGRVPWPSRLEMARRFQPDLVIMDVRLPGWLRDRSLPGDPRRVPRDPRGHAHQLSRRGSGDRGDRRRRQRIPPQAGPRPRPRRGARGGGSRRVAAGSGRDRQGPRADAPDRDRRTSPTSLGP